jgi:hypothetical protein
MFLSGSAGLCKQQGKAGKLDRPDVACVSVTVVVPASLEWETGRARAPGGYRNRISLEHERVEVNDT